MATVDNKEKARGKHRDQNIKKWGRNVHDKGWVYVPNLLIDHQAELGLSPIQMNILLVLMRYWWDQLPHPGVARIGKTIGRGKSTIRSHIREMENAGLLDRQYRSSVKLNSQTNKYDFTGLVQRLQTIEQNLEALARKEKTNERDIP